MTDKNNGKYLFKDYDEHRKAPIPQLIWKDHHASWDRSYYDFGHYGGHSVVGHYNFKARYYMSRNGRKKKEVFL